MPADDKQRKMHRYSPEDAPVLPDLGRRYREKPIPRRGGNDHSAQTAAVPDMPENLLSPCPATGRADAHFLPSHPVSWAHSTGYPTPMPVADGRASSLCAYGYRTTTHTPPTSTASATTRIHAPRSKVK